MIIQCTVEAKYVSTSVLTSQPIQLRRVLEDVDENLEEVASILCDNKATIVMPKNLDNIWVWNPYTCPSCTQLVTYK